MGKINVNRTLKNNWSTLYFYWWIVDHFDGQGSVDSNITGDKKMGAFEELEGAFGWHGFCGYFTKVFVIL
jgi:hypothetical protein